MKNLSVLAAALLIPLEVAARGLPKSRIAEDDDGTIPQLTRITAILPMQQKVECWEVSETTSSASTRRGKGASKGAVHGTSFGSTDDSDLEDVSIFSWGPHATIFDMTDEYSATASIFSGYSFFRVLGGIVNIETSFNASTAGAHAQIESNGHVFADENGDDWFYFEDTTRTDAHKSDDDDIQPGIVMTADSGGNTQLLQISHSNRPSYKKVHDGPCSFTGVRTPPPTKGPKVAGSGAGGAHIDVSFTVQEL